VWFGDRIRARARFHRRITRPSEAGIRLRATTCHGTIGIYQRAETLPYNGHGEFPWTQLQKRNERRPAMVDEDGTTPFCTSVLDYGQHAPISPHLSSAVADAHDSTAESRTPIRSAFGENCSRGTRHPCRFPESQSQSHYLTDLASEFEQQAMMDTFMQGSNGKLFFKNTPVVKGSHCHP